MIVLGIALPYAGFAALCLAMERHHEQVFGQRRVPKRRRHTLRVLGWLLLIASPAPCISVLSWGVGSVLWCGLLTAAVLPLTLLLAYAPRAAISLAPALMVLGALSALLG
jgi:hypothetical protein